MVCGIPDRSSARWTTQTQQPIHHAACSIHQPVPQVKRRRHVNCAARPASFQHSPALRPAPVGIEDAAVLASTVDSPQTPVIPSTCQRSWWGHVGNALTIAALTSSVLLGTPHPSHASDASTWATDQPAAATTTQQSARGMQWLLPPVSSSSSQLTAQTGMDLGFSSSWLELQPQLHDSAQQSQPLEEALLQGPGHDLLNSQGSGIQVLVPGVASEAEDKMLEAVRQLEARVDSAMGAVVRSGPRMPFNNILGNTAASKEEEERVNQVAHMLVSEVWEVVDQNYLDARSTGWDRARWQTLRDDALAKQYTDVSSVYRSIREMMAWGLSDPYCRFITPSELAAMKKYDVTGIGLNLGTSAEYALKTGRQLPMSRPADSTGVFVVGLSKGSPADKMGLKQGDELVEVDGVSLRAKTPFQAASLIAGQQAEGEGSSPSQRPVVELKVRKVDGMTESVSVERPVRVLGSPVTSSLAKGQSEPVGLLRLTSFNARAQRDLKAAIDKLQGQGAKSLVLDLRDNRGGLVSEGLEVARLFLDDDAPIVFTESRSIPGDAPRALGPPLTRLPLLVLVNEHTASASEIVAGALHDNCRAVLVGSRTYGKGLIQSVYELSDGSGMVLTVREKDGVTWRHVAVTWVGKYLTPNRTDIDRSGIQPDFSSRPSPRLAAETLDACRVEREKNVVAPQQRM